MKSIRKFLISLALFPLLFSCSLINNSNNPSDNPSNPDNPGGGEVTPEDKEDIYDMGYTSIRVNNENFYQLCRGLYVNKKPGIYEFDFNLKFAYNQEKGKLYFNYDGEKPLKNELCFLPALKSVQIYENVPDSNDQIPLSTSVDEILDSRNNRLVSDNYINNVQNPQKYNYFHNACVLEITFVYDKVETNMALSYLVDGQNEYTVPMIFLSMPYRKWFGSPYYFYNNIKEEAEARVQLEYLDPVSKEYWQRNSRIKLGGGWSKGYPQRTLNLNFKKDENGNKNEKVKTSIFGDRMTCGNTSKELTNHVRFRLHNGGNCFEQWSGFNDAILQQAMFGTDVATSAYRPCLVYLNGEYWGLMSIREHYSDYYIKQNYGVDDDNVTLFELRGSLTYDDGDENGITYITQLMNFLNDSRFSSSNQNTVELAYQELTEMIDIDSFIDVMLAEYYACNWDFVGNNNNLKLWRAMKTSDNEYEDGKWRFCLHDVDFAFSENNNYFDKNVNYSYNNWRLVRDCMKSKTFRRALIERAEELATSNLSAKHLSDITKEMYDAVKPYKKDFGKRWGQPSSYYNNWINYYSTLLGYFQNRSSAFVNQLKSIINSQYGGY